MAATSLSFLNRLVRAWHLLWDGTDARGFVMGAGVVDRADVAFGKDSETFTPSEYGNYIATSNGVYACATLRAELLSALPLKLYKVNPAGERVEVTRGNLLALLQKVNPFWTLNRLLHMTELSLCLWGECFWFLERGASETQTPREIWWARPDRVRVFPDPLNYIKSFAYMPRNDSTPIPFSPQETIWFRFPNPLDEYEGLSPLAAARLAADFSSAAMQSNRNIFANGLQMAGAFFPKAGQSFTEEQAKILETQLGKRFKGVDKAHRFGVFRYEAEMKEVGIRPKDAEFSAGLKWALEDIARAYKVPLDLIGGQRTYENVNAARKAIYTQCVLPEARFVASELTEQLLPMFGDADVAEFDASDIDVLQEAEAERWTREREQIGAGVLLINEWREEMGREKVKWGDVWWAASSLVPIESAEPRPQTTDASVQPEGDPEIEAETQGFAGAQTRAIEYGSTEHKRLFEKFVRRTEKQEKILGEVVAQLFKRQKDAVLGRLKAKRALVTNPYSNDSPNGHHRDAESVTDEPFDLAEWIKKFRLEVRSVLKEIIADAGADALEDIDVSISFDVLEPQVVRFLEQRAQRFARLVNETTWEELKQSLKAGLEKGESIAELADRVEAVMAGRIRSSAETIARTEVIGASNGGTLAAWKQSEVVVAKTWLAALDDRTRDSHVAAHGQTVDLDKDFRVGGGEGPHPGAIGLAEEDINCRCAMTAVLDTDRALVTVPRELETLVSALREFSAGAGG